MDALTVILDALKAGAAAGGVAFAGAVGKDAYEALKFRIRDNLKGRPDGEIVLARYEQRPDVWEAPMRYELAESGADGDAEILGAAQALLELLQPQQSAAGKFVIQAAGDIQQVLQGENVHVYGVPSGEAGLPDQPMDLPTFNSGVKPDQVQQGWDLTLPRPERVYGLREEGWESVIVSDARGRDARAVIVDGNRIDLIPMRRRRPGYDLSDKAKEYLLAAYRHTEGQRPQTLLWNDRFPFLRVVGLPDLTGAEGRQVFMELVDRGLIALRSGAVYGLTQDGLKLAALIHAS